MRFFDVARRKGFGGWTAGTVFSLAAGPAFSTAATFSPAAMPFGTP